MLLGPAQLWKSPVHSGASERGGPVLDHHHPDAPYHTGAMVTKDVEAGATVIDTHRRRLVGNKVRPSPVSPGLLTCEGR